MYTLVVVFTGSNDSIARTGLTHCEVDYKAQRRFPKCLGFPASFSLFTDLNQNISNTHSLTHMPHI